MDITEYFGALAKYPLKYKFKGIDGYHTDLPTALQVSRVLYDELLELESDSYIDQFAELDDEDKGKYRDKYEYSSQKSADLFDFSWAMDNYFDSLEAGALEERFKMTAVYDAASQCEVPPEDVISICNICGQQPVWWDGEDIESVYYCGMCGASHSRNRLIALREMSVETPLFPFKIFNQPLEFIAACEKRGLYEEAGDLGVGELVALHSLLLEAHFQYAIDKAAESIYTLKDNVMIKIPVPSTNSKNVDIESFTRFTVLAPV